MLMVDPQRQLLNVLHCFWTSTFTEVCGDFLLFLFKAVKTPEEHSGKQRLDELVIAGRWTGYFMHWQWPSKEVDQEQTDGEQGSLTFRQVSTSNSIVCVCVCACACCVKLCSSLPRDGGHFISVCCFLHHRYLQLISSGIWTGHKICRNMLSLSVWTEGLWLDVVPRNQTLNMFI